MLSSFDKRWLKPNAVVPVTLDVIAILIREIVRLNEKLVETSKAKDRSDESRDAKSELLYAVRLVAMAGFKISY